MPAHEPAVPPAHHQADVPITDPARELGRRIAVAQAHVLDRSAFGRAAHRRGAGHHLLDPAAAISCLNAVGRESHCGLDALWCIVGV